MAACGPPGRCEREISGDQRRSAEITSGARYERDCTYDECGSPAKHEEPKSMSLTRQREKEESRMFSGLRSQ